MERPSPSPRQHEDGKGLDVFSDAMRQLVSQAARVARFDSTILITGESGVGKDCLARYVHLHSRRTESDHALAVSPCTSKGMVNRVGPSLSKSPSSSVTMREHPMGSLRWSSLRPARHGSGHARLSLVVGGRRPVFLRFLECDLLFLRQPRGRCTRPPHRERPPLTDVARGQDSYAAGSVDKGQHATEATNGVGTAVARHTKQGSQCHQHRE